MMFEVGQSVQISQWSYNAPYACRGELGVVIDVSGSASAGYDSLPIYAVDLYEHGTLYLTADDIKPSPQPEQEL